MANREAHISMFLNQAHVAWSQADKAPLPERSRKQLTRFMRKNSSLRPLLTARAVDLDDAVSNFNGLRDSGDLVEAEALRLADQLPQSFSLPTIGRLARFSRYHEPFWQRMVGALDNPAYQLEDPDQLASTLVLGSYTTAVRQLLAARRHRTGTEFGYNVVTGLSMMIHPDRPLFRVLFRAG